MDSLYLRNYWTVKNFANSDHLTIHNYWEPVAGSVIYATGTLEFEDGFGTRVLCPAAAPSLGSLSTPPPHPRGCTLVLGAMWMS